MKTTKWMLPVLSIGLMCGVSAADVEKAAGEKAAPALQEAPADIWNVIPEVVAVIDGKNVTREDVKKIILAQLPDGKLPADFKAEFMKQIIPGLVRGLVEDMLLEKEIAKNNISVSADAVREKLKKEFAAMPEEQQKEVEKQFQMQGSSVDEQINKMAESPMVQKQFAFRELMEKKILPTLPKTTDEQAKEFYDKNIQQFKQDAMVQVSHILYGVDEKATDKEAADKEALNKAIAAYKELQQNPENFGKIAQKDSLCPSKDKGGELDPFPPGKGVMVPEFEEAIAGISEVGKIVGPVKTQFGYHLIRLDKKIPAETIAFDAVKENLKGFLDSQNQQKAMSEYMENLKKDYKVEFKVEAPAMPQMM